MNDLEQGWRMPDQIADLVEIGGAEVIQELLDVFLEDVPLRIGRVADAIERSDAITVSREGHALKGSCKQMGADVLAVLAEQWEHGHRTPDRWRPLLTAFQTEFAEVESIMRRHPLYRTV